MAKKEKELVEAAEKMMKELEEQGYRNRFADMQQLSAPKVDVSLVNKRMRMTSLFIVVQSALWMQCLLKMEVGLRIMAGKERRRLKEKWG